MPRHLIGPHRSGLLRGILPLAGPAAFLVGAPVVPAAGVLLGGYDGSLGRQAGRGVCRRKRYGCEQRDQNKQNDSPTTVHASASER